MTADAPIHVAFVCDATDAEGLGHLSRCTSLAEAFVELGARATVVAAIDAPFGEVLSQTEIATRPVALPLRRPDALAERLEVLDDLQPDLVVTDSYHLTSDAIGRLGLHRRLCAIDDFAALATYPCDAVVNFTVAAPDLVYETRAALLLGPRHLLARRSLRDVKAHRVAHAPDGSSAIGRVAVSMGGVDRSGMTARIARHLAERHPDVTIDVVAGRPPQDRAELTRLLSTAGAGSSLTVGARDLAPHLAAADAVICGGGLTKYEAAYLELPTLVFDQTDEQAGETAAFAARGLARRGGLATDLGDPALGEVLDGFLLDEDSRSQLSASCRDAFPADPTAGVARALLDLLGP